MFLEWLLDQSHCTDCVGKLARLVYSDTNNGCLNYARSAQNIQDHFADKHKRSFPILQGLLHEAFKEYAASLAKK